MFVVNGIEFDDFYIRLILEKIENKYNGQKAQEYLKNMSYGDFLEDKNKNSLMEALNKKVSRLVSDLEKYKKKYDKSEQKMISQRTKLIEIESDVDRYTTLIHEYETILNTLGYSEMIGGRWDDDEDDEDDDDR